MIKLINDDCLSVMRSMAGNSVDITVTSPPYNLNKRASGGGSSNRNYDGWYADDMPEEEYQSFIREIQRAGIISLELRREVD